MEDIFLITKCRKAREMNVKEHCHGNVKLKNKFRNKYN